MIAETGKISLHQIVAVISGRKSEAERMLTDTHHKWNEKQLSGITRSYTPLNEDGDKLPPEGNNVQIRVKDVVSRILPDFADYMNLVYTQEKANTEAKADIVVGSNVIAKNVPVGALLFLSRKIEDLSTFIDNLPVLSPDKEWTFDSNRNCYSTQPQEQVRTQKVPQVLTKAEATKEHPAQTEVYHVDRIVGTWKTINFSGCITATEKAELQERCRELSVAVKLAREAANSINIEQERNFGSNVLKYIFGDLAKKTSK